MSAERLLGIIAQHCGASGDADAQTVEREYGSGFNDAFLALVRRGLVNQFGPRGSITLSAAGRRAAGGDGAT